MEKECVVFTNGCFDIIHYGHIELFKRAKNLGSKLIVGLNSDSSIKQLKGDSRPINNTLSRYTVLDAIQYIDAVIVFYEQTPIKLIESIKPDVLVKGSDWNGNIVGSEFVESYGGRVETIKLIDGISTTEIIKRIRNV